MAQGASSSSWQRNVIGASALALLAAAGLLFAGFAGSDGPDGLAASLLRMGLVFAVLWLAWPQAMRPASLAVVGCVLATVLVVTKFPRLFPLFFCGLLIWGLLRPRLWKMFRGEPLVSNRAASDRPRRDRAAPDRSARGPR